MNIVIKKTNELSELEKKEICILFNDVFKKEKTVEEFETQFCKTYCNYSYHGLMIENEKIIGCYSSIPFLYNYFGNQLKFAVSVDTMIKEEFRGSPFVFKKLANKVYDFMKVDNVCFVFGFPNDNIYLVRKKILKWKDIGMLDFYILPTSSMLDKFKLFDNSIKMILKIYSKLIVMFATNSNKVLKQNIIKVDKSNNWFFANYRYLDKKYDKINYNNSTLIYAVYKEGNNNVCYIIDINLDLENDKEILIAKLLKNTINKIDMILFVSNININSKFLFKVPIRYQPKNIYVSGMILDSNKVDERVFNIDNWNLNLSNYDVR